MDKRVYRELFQCETEEEALKRFEETLTDTNRTFDFFVDWQKIRKNVEFT